MERNQWFRKALEEADLDDLFIRLRLYTQSRLAGMFWRGDSQGPIPGGWEPADFIQAAFRKGLTQERIWKPSEQSLFDFLKGIISSDISNQALKSENQVESRIGDSTSEPGNNFVVAANLAEKGADLPDASLRNEAEKQLILEKIGTNELDRSVVQCVLGDTLSASAEIAAELHVPVNEIYKSKRRLRQKLQYLRMSTRKDWAD
jgi:hypothetical protein